MRKSKPFLWLSLALLVPIVFAFGRAISYEKTGSPIIFDNLPSWTLWVIVAAIISFQHAIFYRTKSQNSDSASNEIFREKAPVKLVLLSLVVWLVSSYLFGLLIEAMSKATYPPLAPRIAPALAWIPTIAFFLYFRKRSQNRK